MVSNFCPQITLLSHDRLGISETFFEPRGSYNFYVFCDALYLADPSKNEKIARRFEKIIKEYIEINWEELNEKLLRKAIDHAQNYFHKHYLSYEHRLKVNAVIIAYNFLQHPSKKPHVFIAGLGDIKVYHLDSSMQLIYYDPEIPQLPENLSLKKRFQYNTNSIGVPDFKCHISRSTLDQSSAFLIASYGAYQQTLKEKLFYLFSNLESRKNQIYKILSRSKDKDHSCFYAHINHQKEHKKKQLQKLNQPEPHTPSPLRQKKSKGVPLWVLKMGSVAILSLLCLELFNYYLKNNSSASALSHSPQEQVNDISSSIKNHKVLKKPLEFPFLKERAFISELKEKHDNQELMIKQLKSIIEKQDQVLRSMNIEPKYTPPQTSVSAGSYNPDTSPVQIESFGPGSKP